jgi:hypothetical protein
MVRPLSEIIRDTDEIVSRRVSEKTASPSQDELTDDDVFKLAEQIRKAPSVPTEKKASQNEDLEFTMREKIAHAVALVDTLLNLPTLIKVAQFEDSAKAQGYSDAEITAQLEKTAGIQFRSVLSEMPWFHTEN